MQPEQANRRFDLYGALYLLCVRWHSGQWSRGYRMLGKLANAGYSPGATIRNGHGFESDEQRSMYRALLRHRHKL